MNESDFSRHLAKNFPGILLLFDREGRIHRWNHNLELVTGYSSREIEAMEASQLFDEAGRSRLPAFIDQVLGEGGASLEASLASKDRRRMSYHLKGTILEEGGREYVMACGFDISGRVSAERDLFAAIDLIENTFANLRDAVLVADPGTRTIMEVNRAFERIFGYSRDEAVGRNTRFIFASEEKYREFGEMMMSGLDEAGMFETEYEMRRKDGSLFPCKVAVTEILDGDGRRKGIIGAVSDITGRRQTEEVLRESEERYRTLAEAAQDDIFIVDYDGRIKYVNRFAALHLGWQVDEIVGRSITELFPQETAERQLASIRGVFESGEAVYIEARSSFPAGDMWLGTSLNPVRDAKGKTTSVLGISRDITARKNEQAELLREKEQAQKYLDIAGVMVVVIDDMQKVKLINGKGSEILGYPEEEIVGSDWFDRFIPEQSREEMRKACAQLMAGRAELVQYFENPVINAKGEERLIAWHNTLLTDSEGNVTGMLSSGEDITERKQAETTLRESEQRFRTIFDTVLDGILVADMDSRRFLMGNSSICEMLGYTAEEVTRLGVEDIHPPQSVPYVVEQFGKQARGEITTAEVIPVKRKDGSVFYADISASPVTFAGEVYLIGFFHDITARKRAEDLLRESEEKYRSLFEGSPVAMVIHKGGAIAHANRAAAELVGAASVDDLIGSPVIGFVHPEYREKAMERISRVIAEDTFVPPVEERFIRLDGRVIDVEVSAMPVTFEGEKAIQVAVQDVTDRKLLEQQLIQAQKMESVGNLAGGVAHDFNNFLTAIQGYADLALMELPDGSPVRDHLKEIGKSADRATDLTRQLLLFGRREDVNLQTIDLGRAVAGLQKMLGRIIGERYTIVTRLPGDLSRVTADKGLIEQVIMNLVVNARDAMPEGGEIFIEAGNLYPDEQFVKRHGGQSRKDYVRLSIRDEGTGIDEHTRKHIFEPFFTTKEAGKGTGLGLSVVYGIVSQHDGLIDVESAPGEGTVFNIYLPASARKKASMERSRSPEQLIEGAGRKILLVEDDEAVRGLATRMLARSGFDVHVAASAREAADMFKERCGDFSLVFSDVILPDDNGVNLVERLRELNPELAVLLASGYTGDQAERFRIENQGFGFLQKPYIMSELLKSVGRLLK